MRRVAVTGLGIKSQVSAITKMKLSIRLKKANQELSFVRNTRSADYGAIYMVQ